LSVEGDSVRERIQAVTKARRDLLCHGLNG